MTVVSTDPPDEPEAGGQGWSARRLLPLALVVPHSFEAWWRSAHPSPTDVLPKSSLGARQIGEAVLDELVIAANALVRTVPDLTRVQASAQEAVELGPQLAAWSHQPPVPLIAPDASPARRQGLRYEEIRFETGLVPPPELDRCAPWLLGPPNGTVVARILRHRGAPRPWVVCIHGTSQGRPDDLFAFRAGHLFARLGLNVAMPVLPLHGPRSDGEHAIPGFDMLVNVAATWQAIADVRRRITWLKADGDPPVVAYGVSLGGYVASLLATVEPDLAGVVAAVPLVDMHALLAWHLRRSGGSFGAPMAEILDSAALAEATACIDPRAARPLLPPDRLAIVAGLNDRVVSTQAIHELWEHWARPPIAWYPGSHIGHLWSSELRELVDRTLVDLTGGPVGPSGSSGSSEVEAAS